MRRSALALAWFAAVLAVSPARAADPVADFYKGSQVLLQIGAGPAGGYTIAGRLVARYIGKYIPGHPTVVAENVPGGGSLVLANQFGNTTKRDGSVFGVMNAGMPTTPLLEPEDAHFDPRTFGFLGSPGGDVNLLVAWHTAPVRALADVFTRKLLVGATSPGSSTFDIPYLANALLGAKFQMVAGYPSLGDIMLAMQRGEVQADAAVALSSIRTQYQALVTSRQLAIIAQWGLQKSPDLPDTPLFPLGAAPSARQMFAVAFARESYGSPFVTPPGVPPERLAALRRAFAATMADPGFLADARRARFEINPISGQALQDLTQRLYATPASVLSRLQALIQQEGRK